MCRDYANGKNCFVAGVNPKKAGEDFEGIPIYGTVKDAKAATGATRLRDLRAAALRGRGHRRGGRRRPRPRDLHHRGHPGARHDPHARPHARQARRCCSARTAPGRSRPRRSRSASCPATSTARAASAWCRARARSPTRRSGSSRRWAWASRRPSASAATR